MRSRQNKTSPLERFTLQQVNLLRSTGIMSRTPSGLGSAKCPSAFKVAEGHRGYRIASILRTMKALPSIMFMHDSRAGVLRQATSSSVSSKSSPRRIVETGRISFGALRCGASLRAGGRDEVLGRRMEE